MNIKYNEIPVSEYEDEAFNMLEIKLLNINQISELKDQLDVVNENRSDKKEKKEEEKK